MFPPSLEEFKFKQNDFIKQAEYYRLVKSVEQTESPISRLLITLGQKMVASGQQLLALSGTAS